MMHADRGRAFTLVEVVVALGLLAGSALVAVSLQNSINRSVEEIGKMDRAAQLVDAVLVELQRIRDLPNPNGQSDRLDGLASSIPSSQGPASLRLVGARDGTRVVREGDLNDAGAVITPAQRFYLIEVRQQPAPLGYLRGAGYLALTLKISWPYALPAQPSVSALPRRVSSLNFNAAMTP